MENKNSQLSYEELVGIVSKFLESKDIDNIEKIDLNTINLYEAGITSFEVMGIVSELRKRSKKVGFAQLMKNPYISSWWEILRNQEEKTVYVSDSVGNERGNETKGFNLTDVQYAYWVGRDVNQVLGGVSCHGYLEIETENLNLENLRNAWMEVQFHHPMLRNTITSDGKQQIRSELYESELVIRDFSNMSIEEREKQLVKIREKNSHRLLSVERGQVAGLEVSILNTKQLIVHFDIDLLVADLHSIGIVLRDLANAYNGVTFAKLPADWSFAQHIVETEKSKSTKEYSVDKNYWNQLINELPYAPELPYCKEFSEIVKPEFNRRTHILNHEQWRNIKILAAENEVTPAMIFLTAYIEVLDRFSSSSKFLLNIPMFGRPSEVENIENVVADFTNIMLMPIDCSKKCSFKERIVQVKDQFTETAEHLGYPGVQVIRDLIKIQPDNRVVAPVIFSCDYGMPIVNSDFEQTVGKLKYISTQTPQVLLDFQIFEVSDGIMISWDAVDEAFYDGVIDFMFNQYIDLISWILKDNANLLVIPDILPKGYLNQRYLNLNEVGKCEGDTLHKAIFDNAKERADKIAVVDGVTGKGLTYSELVDEAKKVAECLAENNVSTGNKVAITLSRGIDQIIGVLGVLAAGACYVPVNPEHPYQRKCIINHKANIKHVITDINYIKKLKWSEDVNCIAIEHARQYEPISKVFYGNPEDSAYIIFTSGTTGEPKGVEVSHKSAWNTIQDVNYKCNVNDSDSVLALSSLEFDLSVYDIFGLLEVGGTVVVIDDEHTRDARFWCGLIKQFQISVHNSVPTLFDMLLTAAEEYSEDISSLRVAMLSGDWIGRDLISRLKRLVKGAYIFAMGGATEGAIWSNYFKLTESIPDGWKSVPYGNPLKGQLFRIVDSKGRDCPDWVTGELWIGGDGVAKGYAGDEKLSRSRFVDYKGIRWYKTGDYGRMWSQGIIEFLGRRDNQVKVQGHRIELGEIEFALNQYPGIIASSVCALGEDKKNRLGAFLVMEKSYFNNVFEATKELDSGYSVEQISTYSELELYLEQLSTYYICQALIRLGITGSDKSEFTISSLIRKYEILPDYKQLLFQWLEVLIANKYVSVVYDGNYVFTQELTTFKLENKNERINPWMLDLSKIIKFINQFDRQSAHILTGVVSIPQLMSDIDFIMPDEFVHILPGAKYNEDICACIIKNIAQKNSTENKVFRICEIGARSGVSTEKILDSLYNSNYYYTLTDNLPYYLNIARKKFAGNSRINYFVFEMEDPDETVYKEKYDVIIAANSLHRVRNIPNTLEKLNKMLNKNGLLLIMESTINSPLSLITTGYLEKGFSNFADFRVESGKPLLDKNRWEMTLSEAGFSGVLALPNTDDQCNKFGQTLICGYKTPEINNEDILKVKAHLSDYLPGYMIPTHYIVGNAMPLSANGKVDKKKIQELLERQTFGGEKAYEAPMDELEEAIHKIWCEVLKIDKMSIKDDYFECGGDSIKAVSIMSKLKQNKIIPDDVSIQVLFTSSNIADLAKQIKVIQQQNNEKEEQLEVGTI